MYTVAMEHGCTYNIVVKNLERNKQTQLVLTCVTEESDHYYWLYPSGPLDAACTTLIYCVKVVAALPAGRPSLYSCTPCFTSYAIFFHIVDHLGRVSLFEVAVNGGKWNDDILNDGQKGWEDGSTWGSMKSSVCVIHSFLAPVSAAQHCSSVDCVWNNYTV